MSQCFFCSRRVEVERESLSNACASCSLAQNVRAAPTFDDVPADLIPFRDFIEFGALPPRGEIIGREQMENARRVKWSAETPGARHKAAYAYIRLFNHNQSCVAIPASQRGT